jgi:transcription termination factor Rho
MDSERKVIISVETIRAYDLREGDMITCYAEKRQSVLVATAIMTVNDYVVDTFKRSDFETKPVCFPKEKIIFHENGKGTVARKLLQWLLPIGQGQRGLIFGAPKTGKSTLLADMHLASTVYNPGINVYSLLIDQSPEVVAHFRKTYGKDNVVYTTYEDEPERQVFVADFILKRAKRMAECGRDVLLFVDSFNALARAYNDTDASTGGKVLAGGLESKTVQYLKRYLGTARCFESGGAITIIGSLSTDTGNPADDLLRSELTPIANLEMTLDEKLARQRLYPAFDLLKVRGKFEDASPSSKEDVLWKFICNQYLPAYGWEGVLELFQENDTLRGLQKNAIDKIKEYHK